MKKISFLFILGSVNLFVIFFFTKKLHFFHNNQNDYGMDFFNTLYHTFEGNYYSLFSSVYLPLNYFILEFLKFTNINIQDAVYLRSSYIFELHFIMTLFCLYTFYYFIKKSNISAKLKPQIFIIFATSVPFLFLLERGNLLFLCLPFVFMVFHKKTVSISLAVLINFKIYFLFLLPFLKNENYKFLSFLIFSITFFITSVIFINQDFQPIMFILNLLQFENSLAENAPAIISLTYSPFSFEKVQFYQTGSYFYAVIDKYPLLYLPYIFLTSFYFKLILFLINIYLIWFKNIPFKHSICLSYLFLLSVFGSSAGGYLGILILPVLLCLMEDNLKKNLLIICLLLLAISPLDIVFYQPKYGFVEEHSFFLNQRVVTNINYGIFQLSRSFLLFLGYMSMLYLLIDESCNFSWRFRN